MKLYSLEQAKTELLGPKGSKERDKYEKDLQKKVKESIIKKQKKKK